MKRAKIILTAIVVLAIASGIFAFKAAKRTLFQAYVTNGTTVTTRTIGPNVYTTTIPLCVTTNVWFTIAPDGQFSDAFSTTVASTTIGRSGSLTTSIAYVNCPLTATHTTLLQ